MRTNYIKKLIAVSSSLLLGCVAAGHAANSYWTNSAVGDFTNAANWSTLAVPTAADTTYFTNNSAISVSVNTAVTNSASTINSSAGSLDMNIASGASWVTPGILTVGNTAGYNPTLSLTNGGLVLSASLVIGGTFGGTGTVVMSGGQLVTTNSTGNSTVSVGSSGVGNMTVSGGQWLANYGYVGANSGSSGTLTLNGGTNLFSVVLSAGHNAGSTGSVFLTGGQLVTTNSAVNEIAYVGEYGVGNMTVSGGQWLANGGWVGARSGSSGILTLNGGTNLFSSTLEAGVYAGTTGSVFLAGGQLVTTNSAGNEIAYVGDTGVGNMTVSGGQWLANAVYVGDANGSRGTLNISGGTNQFSTRVDIGRSANATGMVNVTAGNLVITNAGGTAQLLVGRSGQGTFTLNGGTVTADQLLVTNGSQSVFTFNGGTLNTRSALIGAGSLFTVSNNGNAQISGVITNAGTMTVMNSRAIYQGNVVNLGAYVSDPSTNTFNGNFTVGPAATVVAAANDIYAFGSNFVMSSTNRAFDMSVAKVVFADTGYGISTGNTNHTFDLSGSGAGDKGSNWLNHTELATNFSIGTLTIASGNRLMVTGTVNSLLTNALYVGVLDLSAWNTNAGTSLTNTLQAALSLPDINLYYDKYAPNNAYLQGVEFGLWGGGLLIPIPEPSTILIVASGLALLAFRRRRRAVMTGVPF